MERNPENRTDNCTERGLDHRAEPRASLSRVRSAPDLNSPRSRPAPKCIGLTNPNPNQSLFLGTLFSDYLHSLDATVLSVTPAECRGFLDLVLGNRDGKGGWHAPADIVVISHRLFNTDATGRSLLGTHMAQRLRAHGFAGLIGILTSDQTSLEVEEVRICHISF
jgi:hypothetical protein